MGQNNTANTLHPERHSKAGAHQQHLLLSPAIFSSRSQQTVLQHQIKNQALAQEVNKSCFSADTGLFPSERQTHRKRQKETERELCLGHTAQSYTLALFGRRSIWGRGLKQDGDVRQDQQSPLSLPNELFVLICWLFLQIRNNNSSDLRPLA